MKKLISFTFVLLFALSMISNKVEAKVLQTESKKCRGNTIEDHEQTGNLCRVFDDLNRPLCPSGC